MIFCNKVSKSYKNVSVFNEFSYAFPETGMVLLYGESGCGKTTLLNILAGLISFDKGEIYFGNTCYQNKVDWSKFQSEIAYITQDVYFVDYLSVMDNLRLCSVDDIKIEELLTEFDMLDLKEQYPSALSGGERQRIALLQALLSNKYIFLLDEPTASLDHENKMRVLEMIDRLKGSHLIICSSHDREFIDFADDIIDFHNLDNRKLKEIPKNSHSANLPTAPCKSKRKLWPFFNKWYKYPGREKRSRTQMVIIFVLTILALCLGDTPENKLNTNAKYLYNLNQFCVSCSAKDKELLKELEKNDNIKSIVLNYSTSAPDGITSEDDINADVDYNLTAQTIPFEADAFLLSDHIEYGNYYTDEDQIILSYEMAESLGDPASLIGKTYHLELYDGGYDLKIVGIFSKFNAKEEQYLSASKLFWTNEKRQEVFLNSKFTNRYVSNPDFKPFSGERSYVIYFDTYQNMKSSYEYYKNEFPNATFSFNIDASLQMIFETLFKILMPLAVVLIPVTMLFYYQTKKIEMVYNKHIFSVYQYFGYSIKEIKKCWILGNLLEILRLLFISILIATPSMIILDVLNEYLLKWFPYIIFTFNKTMILVLCISILCFSIILSLRMLKHLKLTDWYKIFMEHRDLI